MVTNFGSRPPTCGISENAGGATPFCAAYSGSSYQLSKLKGNEEVVVKRGKRWDESVPISSPTQFIVSGCGGGAKEEAGVEAPSERAGLGRPAVFVFDFESSVGSLRKSSIDTKVEDIGGVVIVAVVSAITEWFVV